LNNYKGTKLFLKTLWLSNQWRYNWNA